MRKRTMSALPLAVCLLAAGAGFMSTARGQEKPEPAAEVKKLLDDSVGLHGQLAGKVGGAFSSSANVGGGNETTVMALIQALLIHGMVVQGSASGDHYGPVAIGDLDDRSRGQCAALGRSIAALAVKLHG